MRPSNPDTQGSVSRNRSLYCGAVETANGFGSERLQSMLAAGRKIVFFPPSFLILLDNSTCRFTIITDNYDLFRALRIAAPPAYLPIPAQAMMDSVRTLEQCEASRHIQKSLHRTREILDRNTGPDMARGKILHEQRHAAPLSPEERRSLGPVPCKRLPTRYLDMLGVFFHSISVESDPPPLETST